MLHLSRRLFSKAVGKAVNFDESALMALGPLDGRYESSCKQLKDYFSEYALIKYRVKVQVEWLKHLMTHGMVWTNNKKYQPSADDFAKLDHIVSSFNKESGKRVKEIESVTNHDVKAVEYYIKEKLEGLGQLSQAKEYVHFCCTSEDINNLAYSVILTQATHNVLNKTHSQVLQKMANLSELWSEVPMLSRTHGQTASPTTVGKEIANFTYRLSRQTKILRKHKFAGKLNGAVGNFNAHLYAYPEYNWVDISRTFIDRLKLEYNPYTTQIQPHDTMCMFYNTLSLANTILVGFSRDVWQYTSLGYFKQKVKKGEIGSSTMPHKVNPIDFENCQGNLGFANGIMNHFSMKLPISRMQRDLSDSTVLRNQGLAFGYSVLGYKSLLKGLDKLEINETHLKNELQNHYEVITEAVQTMLRKYGWENPYELLKEISRGKQFDKQNLLHLINKLKEQGLNDAQIKRLELLQPGNYLGNASRVAKNIRKQIE